MILPQLERQTQNAELRVVTAIEFVALSATPAPGFVSFKLFGDTVHVTFSNQSYDLSFENWRQLCGRGQDHPLVCRQAALPFTVITIFAALVCDI